MFRRLGKEVLVAIVNGLALAMMMLVVVLLLFGWVATVWSSVVMPVPEPMRLAVTRGCRSLPLSCWLLSLGLLRH